MEVTPQRTRPARRRGRLGERAMVSQPRAEGRQVRRVVSLGPNIPPQYPPSREPANIARLMMLAEVRRMMMMMMMMMMLLSNINYYRTKITPHLSQILLRSRKFHYF